VIVVRIRVSRGFEPFSPTGIDTSHPPNGEISMDKSHLLPNTSEPICIVKAHMFVRAYVEDFSYRRVSKLSARFLTSWSVNFCLSKGYFVQHHFEILMDASVENYFGALKIQASRPISPRSVSATLITKQSLMTYWQMSIPFVKDLLADVCTLR
jgi:hypothetical protein